MVAEGAGRRRRGADGRYVQGVDDPYQRLENLRASEERETEEGGRAAKDIEVEDIEADEKAGKMIANPGMGPGTGVEGTFELMRKLLIQ
jgi:hypothetical protein